MTATPQDPPPLSPMLCACGAAAPDDLPAPGRPPVPCGRCGTPLVQPGPVPSSAIEWGLGGGLVAAVAAAFGWMAVAQSTRTGAAWAIPVGAVVVAIAVRAASRSRSPGLQWTALGAFVAFLGVGEVLLYRHALLGRLVEMHALEGATSSPEVLGREEYETMGFYDYLRLEVDLAWIAAVTAGAVLATRILRAVPAVAAFGTRAPEDTLDDEDRSLAQDDAVRDVPDRAADDVPTEPATSPAPGPPSAP